MCCFMLFLRGCLQCGRTRAMAGFSRACRCREAQFPPRFVLLACLPACLPACLIQQTHRNHRPPFSPQPSFLAHSSSPHPLAYINLASLHSLNSFHISPLSSSSD
ncbi:hypothetical protein AA313_de0209187 [Arthrobotrys entomopaga]|nr:hypothetical protein AA313_de0209187 [Arthrobotrys entomopaga]